LPEDNSKVGMQVPVGAVFTPNTEKKNYVWVIDEKTATVSRRAVVTGELVEGGIIIKEGLKPGEWIAIAGVHSLREGQKVRILRDSEA
jgi:multidrug efflux pump subunit AcrA (membrane-fusion protein)